MKYKEYLDSMITCPFCDANIDKQKVRENRSFMLTVCLAPYHKHHLLIVSKRHIERINDIKEEEFLDYWEMQKVGISLMNSLGYDNISIFIKEGKINPSKSVNHLHFHIVPDIHLSNLEHTMTAERDILTPDEIKESILEFNKNYF